MLHALRDNVQIDLRESAAAYFKTLPLAHLTGHYPAPVTTSENGGPESEFLIPVYLHDGNPDPADAAMSRAAGLAMVAYDTNALDSQFLQGWLMRDRFVMRGSLGSGLRIPVGQSLSAGLELRPGASGVSRALQR